MWNRRYYYREKIKKAACWALIIILLPYIVTVFVNGPKIVTASKVDEMTIDVKGGGKMPVEKYCIGILARDMPAEYEEEALKAQAILVRTEVYRAIRDAGEGQKLEKEFWTEKQMKSAWGMRYAENYRKLKNALESTAGQVLFYEDGLAMTPFFNLSNGYTRDAKEVLGKEEYPYLKIVECPEDVNAEDEIQTVVLGEKDIGTMDVEVVETDSVGYVLKIRVGDNTISGEEFRNKYNLASSCFTLQRYNGKLRVTTRGTGHGIGMSQYTANEMAMKKKSYKNILKYFFNGTEIKEVTEIVKGV
ncbi:MAG: SpoIID/LytB domain-containing protein [Dorea longicatena]